MPYLPLARFKEFARKKEALPSGMVVRKQLVTTVDALDDRLVRFTISTGAVDRDNDTVAVDGWDLQAFRLNPVVLWAHDADHLPIGKAVEVGVESGVLKATVEFVAADVPHVGDKAEAVLRLLRGGFLSATSVGFRPLQYAVAKDRGDPDGWFPGVDFQKQELMEFSVVSIPANPEALIDADERAASGMLAGPQLQLASEQVADKGAEPTAEPTPQGTRGKTASVRRRVELATL